MMIWFIYDMIGVSKFSFKAWFSYILLDIGPNIICLSYMHVM